VKGAVCLAPAEKEESTNCAFGARNRENALSPCSFAAAKAAFTRWNNGPFEGPSGSGWASEKPNAGLESAVCDPAAEANMLDAPMQIAVTVRRQR